MLLGTPAFSPRRWFPIAAVVALAAAPGCTDTPNEGCDFVDVRLTVTQTPALRFSWTPGSCGAFELVVTEGTPIRWLTTTADLTNTLHPPIQYGVHPHGASGPTADVLTPGFQYVAILRRADTGRTSAFADTVTFLFSPPD